MMQDYVQALANKDTGGGKGFQPVVAYTPTETDYNVLKRKNAEKELVAFDSFVSRYLDPTSDPAIASYLKQVYPEFIDRRLKEIDSKLDIQRRLAQIKIKGTPDKEDLMFLFTLMNMAEQNSGDWQQFDAWLRAPVFDPNPPGVSDDFSRGFLNARKWLGAAAIPEQKGSLFGANGALLGNILGRTVQVGPYSQGFHENAQNFMSQILNNRR